MPGDIEREIRRFTRRVRLGRFLGGASQALAAAALVLACTLVVVRLFGIVWLPEPRWFALLLVPALVWGLYCARHTGFGRKLSAVHLDRRLGLDGLLITALERDPEGYRERLLAKLGEAGAALPHVRPRPMGLRVLVAAAVIGLLFVLPTPKPSAGAANPLTAEALEEFEAKLEALQEEAGLKEETREELAQRFEHMKDRFQEDGEVSWTDLDALDQKLEHERALQAARLAKAMQDLEAFARGEDEKAREGDAAAAVRMGELLKDAMAAGLLDKLPPDLLKRLGEGASDGEGLSAEGLDAEALKQLAAALSNSAGEALEGLDAGDLLDDLELADLGEILDGELCKLCEGEPKEGCPG